MYITLGILGEASHPTTNFHPWFYFLGGGRDQIGHTGCRKHLWPIALQLLAAASQLYAVICQYNPICGKNHAYLKLDNQQAVQLEHPSSDMQYPMWRSYASCRFMQQKKLIRLGHPARKYIYICMYMYFKKIKNYIIKNKRDQDNHDVCHKCESPPLKFGQCHKS